MTLDVTRCIVAPEIPGGALREHETSAALAPYLRVWTLSFVRALRSYRLYPTTSSIRVQHIQDAYKTLAGVLKQAPSFSIGIRQGSLLLGEEEIYADDDIRNGPSHVLAGNSIFELTVHDSCKLEDLQKLVSILADEGYRPRTGEDLVTLLWRHHLQHIRHRYIDVLASSVRTQVLPQNRSVALEDQDTERLRRELARMVAALSIDQGSGEDTIAVIDGELDTPEACRLAIAEDQRRFGSAIALNERRVSHRILEALRADLRVASGHEALAARLADLLLEALRAESDPSRPSAALGFLFSLFHSMLAAEDFAGAAQLVARVRAIAERPRHGGEITFVQWLMSRFAESQIVQRALAALDLSEESRKSLKIIAFLRVLGDHALLEVLSGLDLLKQATARELTCTLAIELTRHRRPDLRRVMKNARAEVSAQLLRAAADLSPSEQAELIELGLAHSSAAVRAQALRSMVRFAPGVPDQLFARAIHDPDAKVRANALRAIAARKSLVGARQIASLLARPDALERDPAELRLMLVTHAIVGGERVLPELERLLGQASALARGHKGVVVEAIAFALSVIDAQPANELLAKGARALNPKLRGACRAALEDGGRKELARMGALAKEAMPELPALDTASAWFAVLPEAGRPVWPEGQGSSSSRAAVPAGLAIERLPPMGSPPQPRASAGSRPAVEPIPASPPPPRGGARMAVKDTASIAGIELLPRIHSRLDPRVEPEVEPEPEPRGLDPLVHDLRLPELRVPDLIFESPQDLGDDVPPPMLPDDALEPIVD